MAKVREVIELLSKKDWDAEFRIDGERCEIEITEYVEYARKHISIKKVKKS